MRARREALLLVWIAASGCGGKAVEVVVYHTNGIHGCLGPRRETAGGQEAELGGLATLKSLLNQEKRPHLLVDAGDWFQGSPEGTLSRGRAVVELMNAVGYDAATIGNQDLFYGKENLARLASLARFPILAANIYEGNTRRRLARTHPIAIKDVGGVTVGLVGLMGRRITRIANPERIAGLSFRRELEEANEAVAELRARGAQIVIAISHVGFETPDKEPFEGNRFLAENVRGLDLIVGGSCPQAGESPWRASGRGPAVVCTDGYLKNVGRVALKANRRSGASAARAELLPLLSRRWGEDPGVKKLAEPWLDATRRQMDVVLGTSERPLLRDRWAESELGNWLADCMRNRTGADIAFVNSGGIRADMPKGRVTRRDIFSIMPFDEPVSTVYLSGRQVLEVLERGLSGEQGVLQVSGLTLEVDLAALPGQRVASARVKGAPLRPDKAYKTAATGFLISGGDGYWAFTEGARPTSTGTPFEDMLEACVKSRSPVRPPGLGRMKNR